MSNLWKTEGVPHKGWTLEYVYDVREDGRSVDETEYETCMMCNNERIRYVHVVSHPEVDSELRVGCTCAERLTEDYVNPRQRERELRNKASRRENWRSREWKVNAKGNYYLKIDDHFLLIYRDKTTLKYKCKIDEYWGKKVYGILDDAKNAAFDGVEYFKDKGEW